MALQGKSSRLWIVLFLAVGTTACDRVFIVDRGSNAIYTSVIEDGVLLTDLEFSQVDAADTEDPGYITFDPATDTLIWNSVESRLLFAVGLDGDPPNTQLLNYVSPTTLAVNIYERKIYWIGANKLKMNVMNYDASDRILPWTEPKAIYSLNVDGINGFLWWTDKSQIIRSKLDGSERTVIIEEKLTEVTNLFYNPEDNRLYWINMGPVGNYVEPVVESSAPDGSDRTVHMDDTSWFMASPSSIVVHNGSLYFLDSQQGSFGWVDINYVKNNGLVTELTGVAGSPPFQLSTNLYELQIFPCDSVDYCSSSPCPDNSACTNEKFNYTCEESDFINPDNVSSSTEPSDPCDVNGANYPCDRVNGECLFQDQSSTCLCKEGFQLGSDGVICEALSGNNPCFFSGEAYPCDAERGECVYDEESGHRCTCRNGFELDEDGASCYDPSSADEQCNVCRRYIVAVIFLLLIIIILVIVLIIVLCRKRSDDKKASA